MSDPTDHLATVRAALDLAGKATPAPRVGTGRDDDAYASPFEVVAFVPERSATRECHLGNFNPYVNGVDNAAAFVALRNAAPAIAALADECAELRRDKADLYKMFDENPSASWSQLRDARARIATLEAELAQARAHRCGGIVLSAEDADRIAALLEDPPAPTPAMVALFAKAKE